MVWILMNIDEHFLNFWKFNGLRILFLRPLSDNFLVRRDAPKNISRLINLALDANLSTPQCHNCSWLEFILSTHFPMHKKINIQMHSLISNLLSVDLHTGATSFKQLPLRNTAVGIFLVKFWGPKGWNVAKNARRILLATSLSFCSLVWAFFRWFLILWK